MKLLTHLSRFQVVSTLIVQLVGALTLSTLGQQVSAQICQTVRADKGELEPWLEIRGIS